MAERLLCFDHAVKRFNVGTPDENTLFDGFNCDVDEGEFISIVGSNGSGKTTLLNLLCGSLPLDGGRLFYRNRDITRLSEHKRPRLSAAYSRIRPVAPARI